MSKGCGSLLIETRREIHLCKSILQERPRKASAFFSRSDSIAEVNVGVAKKRAEPAGFIPEAMRRGGIRLLRKQTCRKEVSESCSTLRVFARNLRFLGEEVFV